MGEFIVIKTAKSQMKKNENFSVKNCLFKTLGILVEFPTKIYFLLAAVIILTTGCAAELNNEANGATETLTLSVSPSAVVNLHGEPSCTRSYTITNNGTSTATTSLAVTEVSADPSACVSVSTDNCTGELIAPSGNCTLEITGNDGCGSNVSNHQFQVNGTNTTTVQILVNFTDPGSGFCPAPLPG